MVGETSQNNQIKKILQWLATQESQTRQLIEENQRIQGENERLRKELEEARSQSVQQPTQMLVQVSATRDEVQRVLFQEENTKTRSYVVA